MNKESISKLKEKYPGFFKTYSEELIAFALSEKTAQKIASICIENRITDREKVEGVAFRTTYAIFGKLPKENLKLTIQEGLDIDSETAEKIAKGIDEIILSSIPGTSSEKPVVEKEEKKPEKPPEEPPKQDAKDVYREPIE